MAGSSSGRSRHRRRSLRECSSRSMSLASSLDKQRYAVGALDDAVENLLRQCLLPADASR